MKKILFLMAVALCFVPKITMAQEVKTIPAMSIQNIAVNTINNEEDSPDITILSPKEIACVTSSSKALISGVAKEGNSVDIDVNSLILSKGKYGIDALITPVEGYSLEVDKLGFFAQEISLKKGDNLIIIKVQSEDESCEFKYVITYDENIGEDIVKKMIQITESGIFE